MDKIGNTSSSTTTAPMVFEGIQDSTKNRTAVAAKALYSGKKVLGMKPTRRNWKLFTAALVGGSLLTLGILSIPAVIVTVIVAIRMIKANNQSKKLSEIESLGGNWDASQSQVYPINKMKLGYSESPSSDRNTEINKCLVQVKQLCEKLTTRFEKIKRADTFVFRGIQTYNYKEIWKILAECRKPLTLSDNMGSADKREIEGVCKLIKYALKQADGFSRNDLTLVMQGIVVNLNSEPEKLFTLNEKQKKESISVTNLNIKTEKDTIISTHTLTINGKQYSYTERLCIEKRRGDTLIVITRK